MAQSKDNRARLFSQSNIALPEAKSGSQGAIEASRGVASSESEGVLRGATLTSMPSVPTEFFAEDKMKVNSASESEGVLRAATLKSMPSVPADFFAEDKMKVNSASESEGVLRAATLKSMPSVPADFFAEDKMKVNSASESEGVLRAATLKSMPSVPADFFSEERLRRARTSKLTGALSMIDEMLDDEKVAQANETGDYRVKLQGPDGGITVDIWDLSLYPLWFYDHYQSLRREYLKMRANPDRTPEQERYTPPHPGVDYIYNQCPFVSHAGNMDFISMSAHCIFPDGARLPADVDKSMRSRPFFANAGSIKCDWFGCGK
ncbi:hypothetical protein BESB_078860 [Besnoitia besnoiti]|uniref:Uncharacterized protein n=1 Tax=Besnoitia besnoiti TaxID=94643 RepID=A0A2A9ME59_BESBE|nr:hypothetical protein BESB_078860 [Besnoitia besnoiti]PFH33670.1 hypothetical protein BESB_078860 [Besnoitia besnoiti]